MGFFQNLKDSYFLSKCVTQLNHVSPAGSSVNHEFCKTNIVYFIAFRNKGYEHDMAVNLGCIYMIENPNTVMEHSISKHIGMTSLTIASNYCLDFATRWPTSEYTPAFAAAIAHFINYVKTDPIAQESEIIKGIAHRNPSNSESKTKSSSNDESFEKQLSTFTEFLDWQETPLKNSFGKVSFKSQTSRVLYFNFVLAAIDRLANTLEPEELASQFFEMTGFTLAETLFSSNEEAINQISTYGLSEDKKIILANRLGHEAMGIFVNISTTEHPIQTLGIKGFILNDLLSAQA